VVERRRRPRLQLEAPHPRGIGGERRRQDLESHITSEPGVVGPVHLAHAAGAQPADDRVRTEREPRIDHGDLREEIIRLDEA